MTDQVCTRIGELVPEFALGVLDGRERAQTVAHLEHCPHCRAVVREHAEVVDAMVRLIPDAEPPAGFENRVLTRMSGAQSPHALQRRKPWYGRRWMPVAAVFLALALLGGGWGIGAFTRPVPAPQSPPTVAAVASAPLQQGGHPVGDVYLAGGEHPWISMSVQLPGVSGQVSCQLQLRAGGHRDLGSFPLAGGYGHWEAPLPPGTGTPESASVLNAQGQVLATAWFGR